MKWNQTLLMIVLGYTLINILFYTNMLNINGGGSLIYVLIYPVFWLITIIIISVLTYNRRKSWLSKQQKTSTIFLFIFCTPIPLLIVYNLIQPSTYLSSSGGFKSENGFSIKYETWDYSNGKTAVKKFWKNEDKDSLWIYFDKNGDTLKTENYKNNKLINTKEYNKNIR